MNCIRDFGEGTRGKLRHVEDLGKDERIILNLICKMWNVGMG